MNFRYRCLAFLMVAAAGLGTACSEDPDNSQSGDAGGDTGDVGGDTGGDTTVDTSADSNEDTAADTNEDTLADTSSDTTDDTLADTAEDTLADTAEDTTDGAEDATTDSAEDQADAEIPEGSVVFRLNYSTDIPENVYIQVGDDYGLPTWVTVTRDDQQLILFDRCDLPVCGEGGGVCGIAENMVDNVTEGDYSGSATMVWDGNLRTEDAENDCWLVEPAEAGDYIATFCYGYQVDPAAEGEETEPFEGEVLNPTCVDVEFTMPTEEVVLEQNLGG